MYKYPRYKEFLTRFAEGEQYLEYNHNPLRQSAHIQTTDKNYFWQERAVYNKILPMLESARARGLIVKGSRDELRLIELLIPVQRAYNTIRNRKMEIFNRAANGVICVEDGSADTDCLESEGLYPNKVLIYRQGSTPPFRFRDVFIEETNVFTIEEDRLISEFSNILYRLIEAPRAAMEGK